LITFFTTTNFILSRTTVFFDQKSCRSLRISNQFSYTRLSNVRNNKKKVESPSSPNSNNSTTPLTARKNGGTVNFWQKMKNFSSTSATTNERPNERDALVTFLMVPGIHGFWLHTCLDGNYIHRCWFLLHSRRDFSYEGNVSIGFSIHSSTTLSPSFIHLISSFCILFIHIFKTSFSLFLEIPSFL